MYVFDKHEQIEKKKLAWTLNSNYIIRCDRSVWSCAPSIMMAGVISGWAIERQ